MLRNLLLAMFLIALALPAIAVPVAPARASQDVAQDCHGMPIEKQGGDARHQDSGLRLHGCIGCVAPQGPAIAMMPVVMLPFIVRQIPERKLRGTSQRPTIPPPRA